MSTGWLTCAFAANTMPSLFAEPEDVTGPCVTDAIVTFAAGDTITGTTTVKLAAANVAVPGADATTVIADVPGPTAVTRPAADTVATEAVCVVYVIVGVTPAAAVVDDVSCAVEPSAMAGLANDVG